LAEAGTQFPTLKLTTMAWQKLKAKEKIQLAMERPALTQKKKSDYNVELFDQLKVLRFSIAQRENVPPYIVFSDASLAEMATYFPLDEQAFLNIAGVGKVKADHYGGAFLAEIQAFSKAHDIKPKFKPLQQAARKQKATGVSDSEKITYNYLKEGMNLYQIASQREMTIQTIESHLINLVKVGKVEPEKFLSKDDITNIRIFYRRSGERRLKPIKEHFGDRYTYSQIKIALVHEY